MRVAARSAHRVAAADPHSLAGMDAAHWNAKYSSVELMWSVEPNRFVAEILSGWTPGRAIDLACGEGRNAIWLAQQGWHAVGVDFSDVALDKARRLADANRLDIEWVCADATSYVPTAASFDLALLCYFQLPAAEIEQVLQHALAALAPGGVLLFIAHALDNLQHGIGGPQDPTVLYTPEQIAALVAPPVVVERVEHVRRPVTTPDGERDAIDLIVQARRPN
jgi:SAM-dependent methyltransferase